MTRTATVLGGSHSQRDFHSHQNGLFRVQGPKVQTWTGISVCPSANDLRGQTRWQKESQIRGRRSCVDSSGISTRSTVVKGISSRLLDLIAHRDGLKTLCGNVSNAFITAPCGEKVYSEAGIEFGPRSQSLMIIKKALYGLASSSRAFRAYFADFLRATGFQPTRCDRDVWMRLRETNDGYDYLCTMWMISRWWPKTLSVGSMPLRRSSHSRTVGLLIIILAMTANGVQARWLGCLVLGHT